MDLFFGLGCDDSVVMSLVLLLLTILLGLGGVVLAHSIQNAPEGEESEEGFTVAKRTSSRKYQGAKVRIKARTTPVPSRGIHAA